MTWHSEGNVSESVSKGEPRDATRLKTWYIFTYKIAYFDQYILFYDHYHPTYSLSCIILKYILYMKCVHFVSSIIFFLRCNAELWIWGTFFNKANFRYVEQLYNRTFSTYRVCWLVIYWTTNAAKCFPILLRSHPFPIPSRISALEKERWQKLLENVPNLEHPVFLSVL